jgi:NAD(P)-dependent dehydrogenase (short-subunit alcohol dehydrogenase family)
MSDKETAVVVGVGPGLGASLVRIFAAAGIRVAASARNADKLSGLMDEVSAAGGEARAYACDATDEADVARLFDQAGADLGSPNVAIYNAGAFVRNSILDTSSEEFQHCWRVGCLGGFHVARAAATRMVDSGGGTILFTGATAAHRGGAMFHNLAVPKFALRALCQSMARELGPKGVHMAHVVIDGLIMGEHHDVTEKDGNEDALLHPDAIAKNYLMLHHQPRNAWTLEMDLRPSVEQF